MELKLILRMLLWRWYLILIPVVVVAIFVVPDFLQNRSAVAGGFSTVIKYSAAQELNLNSDGDYQDVWLASELTVNAFTDWIITNSFRRELAEVVNDQGIDLANLGLSADNARSIGQIFLSHPDDESLMIIAKATVDVLENENQAYFAQLGGDPAQVTILEEPVIVASPPPLTNRFAPFIRLGIALIAGIALAMLAEYFDQRIRDHDELERIGFRILASIPKHKN